MEAPPAEQRALLELQAHDSAIDRLDHQRASLPEDARLRELGDALGAVEQLTAEREGTLATVQRDQARPSTRSTWSPPRPATRRRGRFRGR